MYAFASASRDPVLRVTVRFDSAAHSSPTMRASAIGALALGLARLQQSFCFATVAAPLFNQAASVTPSSSLEGTASLDLSEPTTD